MFMSSLYAALEKGNIKKNDTKIETKMQNRVAIG